MSATDSLVDTKTPIDQKSNISLQQLSVIRRNGTITPFDPERIAKAITNAFCDVEGEEMRHSSSMQEIAYSLTDQVLLAVSRKASPEHHIRVHVEDIQDQVERILMRNEFYKVARSYVLYREEHRKLRETQQELLQTEQFVILPSGNPLPLAQLHLGEIIAEACEGLAEVDPNAILKETEKNLYNGVLLQEVYTALIMSTRTFIETEPSYKHVAARLLLRNLFAEALDFLAIPSNHLYSVMRESYQAGFKQGILKGIELGLMDTRLASFDLDFIAAALKPERDFQFDYLGLQTLYDRYFIHHELMRFELPQAFFMRVAMGLALQETEKERYAIEFYNLLSSFDYMSSTPTLFNSGTPRPQLSSCYLTTIPDDLGGIYSAMRDNALLSKFAGGLGNDWTPVRALNAHIKGTNGKSQGVVPFMKVANDTAVAVNQGGKRKGAMCAYLEVWHLDIEEFLELRKNTGDDRRRTHDMNTANWIPDLFMKRVIEQKEWTLFSPDEVPDLHDLYGDAFEKRYTHYEALAAEEAPGKNNPIRNFKKIPAINLWRKMLSMLFETGHPWITFKDPCNLRSPQGHVGVVHSSNLCTEITLNTSEDEIAVCNLGSVNLAQHINLQTGELDTVKLQKTIQTAIRMLDNVIDTNLYPVIQARRSNLKHRPIGLGIMGFQDALYQLNIPYASEDAVRFADLSMEHVSYYAISASSDLAKERGAYVSFEGSLWSKGILPIDSINRLQENRGIYLDQDRSQTLDWQSLRQRIRQVGIRNSNVLAIAPTATISNICGVSQSIEPTYQNLFVKSNLSGEFTVINHYLVSDLKALNIWDTKMVKDLKYYGGSLKLIDRIPEAIKQKYATAFEIEPIWLIEAGSRRQKWIDQSQSLNLYISAPSGKKLDATYHMAWLKGLKTTYYLRSLGATDIEKSTLQDGALNAVKISAAAGTTAINTQALACSIDNPDCEACQ
ncbi:MAG: ribonucleoside-diphosphate reductase subunit alpha [Gammaproteobacteria bacterium]